MARSLNRAQLIGNLTRDPELRYTPNGSAVCSFGLATNRTWKKETGEKQEEAEFHNIVAWNKLAELCSQFLTKGRKVYVEGRLATRSWTGQDGAQRSRTEIVISDMILLDSRRPEGEQAVQSKPVESQEPVEEEKKEVKKKQEKSEKKKEEAVVTKAAGGSPTKSDLAAADEVVPDDIPF